jgi:hypothetical protein
MDLMVVWEAVGPAGRRAANRPWTTAGQRTRIRSMEQSLEMSAYMTTTVVVVSSGPGRIAPVLDGLE